MRRVRVRPQVSAACDVYSFGIVMWEVVSGQRPYAELLQAPVQDKRTRDKHILTKVRGSRRRMADAGAWLTQADG